VAQTAPWGAAALIVGAAGGICLDVDARIWLALLGAGWMAAVVAFVLVRPRLLLAALVAGCAGAGGALGDRDAARALDPPILAHALAVGDRPVRLEGRLRDDAEATEFGAALTLDLTRIWIEQRPSDTSGGVRLSAAGALLADARHQWRGGRLLRVTATLRRPQPYRNFGVPDQEARTALRGIRLFGSIKSAALIDVAGRGSFWRETAADARARVRRAIDVAVGARDRQAAAIVTAVLIGDRAGLAPGVEARLQRAGTFHVIAISGGNIAILVAAMLWALRRAGCSPRWQAALALAGIVFYALIVAAGSSVARATLAASLYLVARAIDHRGGAWAIVASTAGALVLAQPLFVLDAGFWLTFVASIAILEQAGTIADRLVRLCRLDERRASVARAPATLLAATIAAEGSLAPITALVFSQVTAAGLVLNFAAVPLMTIVQMAGLVTVALASVHPTLAAPSAAVATLAARGITESALAVDLAPWSAPHVPPPPLWLVVSMVAMWWTAWRVRDLRIRRVAAGLWVCAMAAIVSGRPAWSAAAGAWLSQRLTPCVEPALPADAGQWMRVTVLDVGQGSSTLVRFPDGRAMLVDAGGSAASRFDVGARVVSPALWALGLRRLSAAVLTHGDFDHVGGAAAIVDDFAPREVWEGVPVPSNALLRDVSTRAASRRLRWLRVARGMTRTYGGATVRVWHPPAPDWERPRVRNDDSIVIELRLGDVSLVLPGDIGAEVERLMAGDLAPARLRVLVAAHHGSRTSSSPDFLDALNPRVVVISAGRDNRHGHPSPDVLERLQQRQIQVFRTDLDGAVALDTNGERLSVTACAGTNERWSLRRAAPRVDRVRQ
jgi:competence protein ComEC